MDGGGYVLINVASGVGSLTSLGILLLIWASNRPSRARPVIWLQIALMASGGLLHLHHTSLVHIIPDSGTSGFLFFFAYQLYALAGAALVHQLKYLRILQTKAPMSDWLIYLGILCCSVIFSMIPKVEGCFQPKGAPYRIPVNIFDARWEYFIPSMALLICLLSYQILVSCQVLLYRAPSTTDLLDRPKRRVAFYSLACFACQSGNILFFLSNSNQTFYTFYQLGAGLVGLINFILLILEPETQLMFSSPPKLNPISIESPPNIETPLLTRPQPQPLAYFKPNPHKTIRSRFPPSLPRYTEPEIRPQTDPHAIRSRYPNPHRIIRSRFPPAPPRCPEPAARPGPNPHNIIRARFPQSRPPRNEYPRQDRVRQPSPLKMPTSLDISPEVAPMTDLAQGSPSSLLFILSDVVGSTSNPAPSSPALEGSHVANPLALKIS